MTQRFAKASAFAKLNLSLRITGRRSDGMHEIDSVFTSIDLADTVLMAPRDDGELRLEVTGYWAGPDPLNLALKAAHLFREEFGIEQGFDIKLEKKIPAGSGLGGGSADAAGVLHLARRICKTEASDEDLARIGERLGADIPFCIGGGLARVGGIGEKVEPLAPTEAFRHCRIVLALPEVTMPTAEVYAAWDMHPVNAPGDPPPPSLAGIVDTFTNDLESAAERLVPQLSKLRSRLSRAAKSPARMTGSGAAIFAVVESETAAGEVADKVGGRFAHVMIVSPHDSGVEVG